MTIQSDPERNEIRFLHKFVDLAASRKHVLEIGCGEGRLTWQYAKETRSTIGIDLDRDALRVATIDRPSDLESKVYFALAKSEQLPFSKETFDIAVLAWSL
jgi:ubiquinone/menaquinone biosynthesis C-methylase UbiE